MARRRESGMALILTLGFLSVMLMMVLVLAMSSRTNRDAAGASAAAVRGELVVQSALGEAVARLSKDYRDTRYPADDFYSPSSGSAWSGRRYLSSDDRTASRQGIDDALAVRFAGLDFTPHADLGGGTGWIPLLSKQYVETADGPETRDVLVGRYSYVVIDESGKIDPGAVVQVGVPEEEEMPNLTTVDGGLITEFSLSTLGFDNADRFCPEAEDDYVSGNMPADEGRWFGMDHLARAMGFTQSEMDLAVKTLFPYSFDREQFWRDRNNNGVYDPDEEADRLDVHAFAELSRIYHTFVGPIKDYGHRNEDNELDAGYDDCTWLKNLDNNPWFVNWKHTAFAAYSEPERTYRARSHVAAQVAANIVDYCDPDSRSTSAYLDSKGQIHLGYDAGLHNVSGVERTWALSQVAMRVETDAAELPEGGSGTTVTNTTTDEDVPFTVTNGKIVPSVPYSATVTVLGAQLSLHQYEGGPLMWWCPVTTNVKVGSDTLSPWGGIDDVSNDIQDFNYPKPYLIPDSFPANTPIAVNGKFWNHPYDWATGSYDTSTWYVFRSLSSDDGSDHIEVLVDGDPVPNIGTTSDVQNDVSYYLAEYVEGDKISLQSNQAIYLFETRTASQGHRDYQDLVVLVTLKRQDEEAAGGSTPTVKRRFNIDGKMCNINPNNSTEMQFYLTKPDGTQITRDEMHGSRAQLSYIGPAVRVRVRPKGNANSNYIMLDGTRFDLHNSTVYDFVAEGDAHFSVHLYNDLYHKNGRAMGHWWLGMDGSTGVQLLIDGEPYTVPLEETTTETETETTTETTTATTTDEDPPEPGMGNSLRMRAGFQAEVVYPWAANADTTNPPSAIEVTYRVELTTATGKTIDHRATKILVPDTAGDADGGTVMWNAAYDMDDWVTIEDAFDVDNDLDSYVLTLARIEKVVVKNKFGEVADTAPWGPTVLYEAYGSDASVGDDVFHFGLTAVDPFMNDRGCASADFHLFWDVYPETPYTLIAGADSAPGGFGESPCNYNSGTYAGIQVQNSAITRLGELGRVHSYMPNRSLRFWSATSSDESGHDADILDVFKIGSQAVVRGRVNINTLQPEVLRAMFTDALDVNVDSAVDEVLARRAAGKVFENVGQLFGDIRQITPSNPVSDEAAEAAVVKLAEKLTTRSNYFTVLVCAQAIKDVDGVSYTNSDGETVTASHGAFDVAECGRYVDQILAEKKVMAVVYRDGLTNKTRIERVDVLHE